MAKPVTQEEQDIVARISRAKASCKPWHDAIKLRRRLYDFDHYPVPANKGEHRYIDPTYTNTRSEERRVGKECRPRWTPDH